MSIAVVDKVVATSFGSVNDAIIMRIGDMRRFVARRLARHAIDTPDLDARLIIGHALSLDHAGLVRAAERKLDAVEIAAVEAVTERRLAGEPIARIIGVKEFWGLPVGLEPAVLVPRPETETVVERALAAVLRNGPRTRPLRIADLGVGSGAITLALLSELPNAFAVGTDSDCRTLVTARHNAGVLGLARRAAFVACDFGAALAGGFDLVVANPPYVRSVDIPSLAPEVRDFDPWLALDGGADGLAAYRAIAGDARRLLAPRASLVVEIGEGQAEAVARLFDAAGLGTTEIAPDLAGISRAVVVS
jgi:release factor glutamine methyltransferase